MILDYAQAASKCKSSTSCSSPNIESGTERCGHGPRGVATGRGERERVKHAKDWGGECVRNLQGTLVSFEVSNGTTGLRSSLSVGMGTVLFLV